MNRKEAIKRYESTFVYKVEKQKEYDFCNDVEKAEKGGNDNRKYESQGLFDVMRYRAEKWDKL